MGRDGGDVAVVEASPDVEEAGTSGLAGRLTDVEEPLLRGEGIARERLASLDVFRGLTIAGMILVDGAGGKWPAINHSPWNGVTLADFVMPFFLFIVGVAIALTYKRVPDHKAATGKAVTRSLKLFALGLLLQGGYYHGTKDLSYGVDVQYFRWCGILQRIALAYGIVALSEIWFARKSHIQPQGVFGLFRYYLWHWVACATMMMIYVALIYGLYVPDWTFQARYSAAGDVFSVSCGRRGDPGPACNAVGYIDRLVLGTNHLYHNPAYTRTKACSENSPDYGPLPPNAPAWCHAPFDPEGLLSSLSSTGSCFIGLHYGHVLVHFKSHKARIWQSTCFGLALLSFGVILNYLGMLLNKQLFSVSYVFLSAGAAGLVFSAFYILLDVYAWRKPTLLLEWMGMNSLLIFVFAASGVLAAAIQGLYWKSPENNLVNFMTQKFFQATFSSERTSTVVSVLFEIILWCLAAGVLSSKNVFWKL